MERGAREWGEAGGGRGGRGCYPFSLGELLEHSLVAGSAPSGGPFGAHKPSWLSEKTAGGAPHLLISLRLGRRAGSGTGGGAAALALESALESIVRKWLRRYVDVWEVGGM